MNRLLAMRRLTPLDIVQPVPWFPVAKALPHWAGSREGAVQRVPMLYIPRFLKSLDGRWLARAVGPVLARLHASAPLDAIDAHFGYPDGVGCVAVARRLQVPVFLTLRGVENEQLGTRLIGRQLREAMGAAAGCICVSHFLADLAIRQGVDERKVTVIHNSVEQSIFHAGPPLRSRRELGLPDDRPVILSVGHLVPRKRHHVLIEALADPRVRGTGALLVILGSPAQDRAYAARLEAMIRALRIDDSVRFLGNRPPTEVGDYLRVADAFALLSVREGCCNALLEALACGVPVLATDVGDNRYFVNESNGRIVAVDEVEEAGVALREMLATTWRRESVAKTMPAGDWNDVARKVIDYMQRVLSGAWSARDRRHFAADAKAGAVGVVDPDERLP